jgi:type II secretory ATPase GspE/PulE/Tfp pilus assembly ATPase PilB-like protein
MLCPACRVPRDPVSVPADMSTILMAQAHQAAPLGVDAGAPQLMMPKGCDACGGLGYRGRAGLYELLVLDDTIRPLVLERASISTLREAARKAGMHTLREDGLAKARAGDTTLEEVLRETQDYD